MQLGQSHLGRALLGGSIQRSAAAGITITSPTAGETVANEVYVLGTTDTAGDVEYRVDGGSWATLATPSGGNYSGLVTGLVAGSRTIDVRQSDATSNTASVSVTVVNSAVSITSPVPHQLIRRGVSSTASIAVTFDFTGVHPDGWEARLNRTGAESWQTFAQGTTPRTVTLTGEPRGFGTIEVRSATNSNATDSVTPVAVGRAIAFMGQSNSSGRGTNNQSAPTSGAYLYDNTGAFRALADPFDGNFSGSPTYSVLDDSTSAGGSIAPRLAQNFVDDGEPLLCIPVNKGGTGIASWAVSASTSTLYGASKARIDAAGGCDWVIWQQGEQDIDVGTAQATYEAALTSIVNDLVAEYGCEVALVKLYYDNGGTKVSERNAIRAAIQAVADADIGAFVALDLATDNSLHLTTNTQLTNAADGIYSAMTTGPDVTAPVLTSPTGSATGTTTATIGATTDEGNGTIYGVVTTSSTPPSAAQVKSGLDHTGSFAEWAGNAAVGSTGAKTLNAAGLSASTGYYGHLMHEDAAANQSNVISTSQFVTDAAPEPPDIPSAGGSTLIGMTQSGALAVVLSVGGSRAVAMLASGELVAIVARKGTSMVGIRANGQLVAIIAGAG